MQIYPKPLFCFMLTIFLVTKAVTGYTQETKINTSLTNYLAAIDSAFVHDNTTHFNQLVPLAEIQSYYAGLVLKKINRKAGAHRVLRVYADSAFVLLTGMVNLSNSGDETNSAVQYSGIYRLKKSDGRWQLQERIAFDRLNHITAQHIQLAVKPGEGMAVKDTLTISNNDVLGF